MEILEQMLTDQVGHKVTVRNGVARTCKFQTRKFEMRIREIAEHPIKSSNYQDVVIAFKEFHEPSLFDEPTSQSDTLLVEWDIDDKPLFKKQIPNAIQYFGSFNTECLEGIEGELVAHKVLEFSGNQSQWFLTLENCNTKKQSRVYGHKMTTEIKDMNKIRNAKEIVFHSNKVQGRMNPDFIWLKITR